MTDRDILKKWFTGLSTDEQYTLLKFNYDICHYGIGVTDNNNKVKMLEETIEKLRMENDIIRENNNKDVKETIDKLYNNILSKFTGTKKGYINERLIYDILIEKYPKCDVRNVSSSNGCGDINMNVNGVRFMIECKMHQENTLRTDPDRIFERFKKDSIKAIEDGTADICIFISAGSKIIPNYGTFESEEIITKKGKSYLIYISDIYNYPERIDAAIELGVQFSNNMLDDTTLYSKVLDAGNRMNKLSKYVYKLEMNMRDEGNILLGMKEELGIIEREFKGTLDNIRGMDGILDIIKELIGKYGFRDTTTKILEEEFKTRGIPLRKIRDCGGIKKLKTIANKQLSRKGVLDL